MKPDRTCPPAPDLSRRGFLKRTLAASAASAALGLSFEEQALLAADPATAVPPGPARKMSTGFIGKVEISRLICGGNLISGYAHSRDLIYVSSLLKHYFTDERIMQTWAICEANGINTMVVYAGDQHAVDLIKRYRKERGGRMQWLCQAAPAENDLATVIKRGVDDGAIGVFLVGNLGDQWTFDQRLDLTGRFVELVREQHVLAGVAGHSVKMVQAVEAAGIRNDFYMKTLHSTKYWSHRRSDQTKPVIKDWAADNYFDMYPQKTIALMEKIKKPWIAYKVLAAGALQPYVGFDFAFRNGADFACVGMFDWQVAEDVSLAERIIGELPDRRRPWRA